MQTETRAQLIEEYRNEATKEPGPFPRGWREGDGWTPGQLLDHDLWIAANAVRERSNG